ARPSLRAQQVRSRVPEQPNLLRDLHVELVRRSVRRVIFFAWSLAFSRRRRSWPLELFRPWKRGGAAGCACSLGSRTVRPSCCDSRVCCPLEPARGEIDDSRHLLLAAA